MVVRKRLFHARDVKVCPKNSIVEYNLSMDKSAHIFTPVDDSLESRMRAYHDVYQAWMSAEMSLKYADDPEWKGTLGTQQEIEAGYQASIQGMKKALAEISIEDIDKACDRGLIDADEAKQISMQKLDEQQFDINREKELDKSLDFGL